MDKITLNEAKENITSWIKWGPYLSERQWGTVREDYRESGVLKVRMLINW